MLTSWLLTNSLSTLLFPLPYLPVHLVESWRLERTFLIKFSVCLKLKWRKKNFNEIFQTSASHFLWTIELITVILSKIAFSPHLTSSDPFFVSWLFAIIRSDYTRDKQANRLTLILLSSLLLQNIENNNNDIKWKRTPPLSRSKTLPDLLYPDQDGPVLTFNKGRAYIFLHSIRYWVNIVHKQIITSRSSSLVRV